MALKLETTLDTTGISGEYWRISRFSYSIQDDRFHVEMSLYKDEAARRVGKQPIDVQLITFQPDVNFLSNPIPEGANTIQACLYTLMYNAFKTLSIFKNAIDC
jgi:hypothetical protein